jgi:predicted nucleic acid-binding protein
MRLVVDASVALKWFLVSDESDVEQALAVAAAIDLSETSLFAPCHWEAEVIAVLARVEPLLVDDALLLLHDMSPTRIQSVAPLKRAADMASSLEHHLFDTLYHAVALEEGATLVTADEAYFSKAQSLGAIQRLAEFSA